MTEPGALVVSLPAGTTGAIQLPEGEFTVREPVCLAGVVLRGSSWRSVVRAADRADERHLADLPVVDVLADGETTRPA